MLINLKVKNLILVDQAEITFDEGLNIFTGETGSGKSAILSAIRLIAGARADSEFVGKKGSLAVVEAELFPYTLPDELEASPQGEPLHIRREIHKSGKNRCFANDQQISLNTLRSIVRNSIEIVDQSTTWTLSLADTQRDILDTFARATVAKNETSSLYIEKSQIHKKLESLEGLLGTKDRELSWAKDDLAIIDNVHWQEGEEEALHQKHDRLIDSQDLGEKLSTVSSLLDLNQITQAAKLLESCRDFAEETSALKNALSSLLDVQQSIDSFFNSQEFEGEDLSHLEERLTNIEQVKRRFGKTWAEVQKKREDLTQKITQLETLDFEIEETKNKLKEVETKALLAAKHLREVRQKHVPLLTKEVSKALSDLNLPSAEFKIDLRNSSLTAHGIDEVQFLFTANKGHPPAPIDVAASGGELSRLLFSLKLSLSAREENDCLIFDEIDANVGGITATILGQKLKNIASFKQVICVTHFAQVAQFGDRHFVVSKEEKEGLTLTHVRSIEAHEKSLEYKRMQGTLEAVQT